MGKSRFEGMEIAIREQSKIAEAGAEDKIKIQRLNNELESIDSDTEQAIEEIKSTPINKELLEKKAKNELDSTLKTI